MRSRSSATKRTHARLGEPERFVAGPSEEVDSLQVETDLHEKGVTDWRHGVVTCIVKRREASPLVTRRTSDRLPQIW
jgi:hypothetical protein